jgi:hypothetical protein
VEAEAAAAAAVEDAERVTYDLEVVRGMLPQEMASGRWCSQFKMSDHAPLQCVFRFRE